MSKTRNTAEGYITAHYYTHKTAVRHDWEKGYYKVRNLTRSFETLEQANAFADGKQVVDIYRSKGRFVVEWQKTIMLDGDGNRDL